MKEKRKGSVQNNQRESSSPSAAFWQRSQAPATCSFLQPPSSNIRYSLLHALHTSRPLFPLKPAASMGSPARSAPHLRRAPHPQHTHTHCSALPPHHTKPSSHPSPPPPFAVLHAYVMLFLICSGIQDVRFY